jgi:hypothetical protein
LENKLFFNEAVTMFKVINNIAPTYLSDRFVKKEIKYDMRQKNILYIGKPNTEYKKRSFSYRGALLWNSLDDNIKYAPNLAGFKHVLKYSS